MATTSKSRSTTKARSTTQRRVTKRRATTKRRETPKVGAASPRKATPDVRKPPVRRWSAKVMAKSDAMDLESGVFKLRSASAVARSLKHSAETSRRRKTTPFRSAMSMLNFEINRAGRNLTAGRLRVLNQAKQELRKLFGRAPVVKP